MAKRSTIISVRVEYDDVETHPRALAEALDNLIINEIVSGDSLNYCLGYPDFSKATASKPKKVHKVKPSRQDEMEAA
jgi:hypothetical protein